MPTDNLIDDAALCTLFGGLSRFRSILLAVSGGSDSMALMHLAARWAARGQEPQHRLIVATIDHGLRPGSADEAAFVAAEAGKLGLHHAVLNWQGEKPGSGLQAAAREARYGLLTEFARQQGCEAIVTAHTTDDQAETFLMRLARGSGIDGLAAMLPHSLRDGIALMRPLLGMTKHELRAVLQHLGAGWVEDPSNDNMGFERIRIRKALLLLDEIGIEATSLAASAARLARARLALEAGTAALVARAVSCDITGLVRIDRAGFAEAPEELALRLLGRAVSLAGGGQPVRLGRLEAVLTAVRRAESKGVTLAGAMIRNRATQIELTREALRGPLPVIAIRPGESAIWDRRFRVSIEAAGASGLETAGLETPGLEVRALGPDATLHLKALTQTPTRLPPRELLATMPGFWLGERLIAAPQLEAIATSDKRSAGMAETDAIGCCVDPVSRKDHFSVAFLAHHMQLASIDMPASDDLRGGEWREENGRSELE